MYFLGKAAVITVLSMSSNLECLLPFVECAGKHIRSFIFMYYYSSSRGGLGKRWTEN